MTHATEVHPNWAPTPVKVVGPEREPHELFLHKQAQSELPAQSYVVKKEPPSLISTPSNKTHFTMAEEIYPIQTPKVQSRSTAKLTNMFAEDLPNSDEKPPIKHQQLSPMVNTYNMHFTVSGAASDYDLFAPNRQQPNNYNKNNANRGRPGRGRAPVRGVPNRGAIGRAAPSRGAVLNRGVLGRAAPGRGIPARGGVPREVPGHGNPHRGQGPRAVPARNQQGNPQPPNSGGRNPPNPNPNPPYQNPNPPPNPVGPGHPGGPGGSSGPEPPGPNGPPLGLPTGGGADPAVVAILNRLVQAQEKQVTDKKDTK